MLSESDVFYGDMRNHQPVEGAQGERLRCASETPE